MATISLVNRARIAQIFTVNLTRTSEERRAVLGEKIMFSLEGCKVQGIYMFLCSISGRVDLA